MTPATATALAVVPDAPAGGLVERVQAAISEVGSQAKAAKQMGISGAALSQWLRGEYKGSSEAVAAKAARWLAARTARADLQEQLPPAPDWVETAAAKKVGGALFHAQMASDLVVVYGGAGTGKTAAARRYASSKKDAEGAPNVWLATITAGARTIGPCLERVALAVGLKPIPSRSWRIESALVDRLLGTNGLVIVDEAQHLDVRSLDALRGIHDAAEVGLALLGNELVYARLTGGGRNAAYAQLWSRIGKRVRIGETSKSDADALALAFGVMDADARKKVTEVAAGAGALRGVVKTLRLASLHAAGAQIALQHVVAAQKDLGIA